MKYGLILLLVLFPIISTSCDAESIHPDNLSDTNKNTDAALPATYTNSIGMEFVLIPAGSFEMGCAGKYEKCHKDDSPQRRGKIKKPFYMSKYEVTQKEWKDVTGSGKIPDMVLTLFGRNPSENDRHPQNNVEWPALQDFIRKINEMEKTNHYRLPTGAEWEYAARAGTPGEWPWFCGKEETCLEDFAWQTDPPKNSPPCTFRWPKKTNPWGLYDMYGNVWEWVDNCGKDELSISQGTNCPHIKPTIYSKAGSFTLYRGNVRPDNQPPHMR
ncbi:MAG: formylglycine-generating enzyme family protein [Azoarcus sp.]|nr:formylglycine-generating enzyme family protein [Azoarcus sp.]